MIRRQQTTLWLGFCWGVTGLIVGSLLAPQGSAGAAGIPERIGGPTGTQPAAATEAAGQHPTAEVVFDPPRRFALIMEVTSKRQRLYGAGDVILEPKGTGAEMTILQIANGRLRIDDTRSRKSVWVAVGSLLPGISKRLVAGTPELGSVEFHYVPTGGPLDPESRVVALQGNRAVQEIDTPLGASISPPPQPESRGVTPAVGQSPEASRQLDKTLLGQVRVKATAKDTYEINAADLNTALEQSGKVLAETWPKVWPNVSLRQGVSLQVQSPVADGTLGPRGFQVAAPNLAERGGIEVGDVILAVNGQPINNLADLYRVYNQFQKDSSLSLIQLDLERKGRPVTKTYRVR